MARHDENHKKTIAQSNALRKGIQYSSSKKKIELFEREFLIPLIIKYFECFFENSAIPVRLKEIRQNQKKWSIKARSRFNEIFTVVQRAGRTNAEHIRFPSRINMDVYQRVNCIVLLRAHGYENQARMIEKFSSITVIAKFE